MKKKIKQKEKELQTIQEEQDKKANDIQEEIAKLDTIEEDIATLAKEILFQ